MTTGAFNFNNLLSPHWSKVLFRDAQVWGRVSAMRADDRYNLVGMLRGAHEDNPSSQPMHRSLHVFSMCEKVCVREGRRGQCWTPQEGLSCAIWLLRGLKQEGGMDPKSA
uniref:Uncharacterized protein n=1 Tax=Knipowitschia caucasica TaxID=637954 RepID=A0AAV2LNM3_KNICA